ncbi:hypothetical protein BVRB_6g150630 [Beta vulgaris subsp. vulgaris]|nr:hypothetical protein BVRB_6g150630 [Beta vulgaris subsp. vulgaris]
MLMTYHILYVSFKDVKGIVLILFGVKSYFTAKMKQSTGLASPLQDPFNLIQLLTHHNQFTLLSSDCFAASSSALVDPTYLSTQINSTNISN